MVSYQAIMSYYSYALKDAMSPILDFWPDEQKEATRTLVTEGHMLGRHSLKAAYDALDNSAKAMATGYHQVTPESQ